MGDPFFTHVRTVLGDSVTYACKVLDLNTIPQAEKGAEVTVYVKYTHNTVSLKQIDDWMRIYGELKSKSRCINHSYLFH